MTLTLAPQPETPAEMVECARIIAAQVKMITTLATLTSAGQVVALSMLAAATIIAIYPSDQREMAVEQLAALTRDAFEKRVH